MRNFKSLAGIFALTAAIGASTSCGDVARLGRSPVFLVINTLQASAGGASAGTLSGTLQSDVLTLVRSPAPCTPAAPCPSIFSDTGSVSLRTAAKDVLSPSAPTTNNDVTINRYRVVYRRADGRKTQGVDVPYAFDGAVTGTVPAAGTLTLGFEIVRHVAKMESPLVQLINSPTIISTIADVTFYGADRVGNDISVTGSITIDFGNFGDN